MANFKSMIILLLLASLFLTSSVAYALRIESRDIVLDFIDSIKSGNKEEVLKFIIFPLNRHYPLPSIKTPEEFFLRFDEVFDLELIEVISNSTLDDWSEVGWRGIMLNNGTLWLDFDRTLLGVNYQSEIEKQRQIELIEQERETLYSGLREYLFPVLDWETKSYKIRIDYLGEYEYRYASWSMDKETSEKPDLVLYQGILIPDGSGGNRYYEFHNGEFKYVVYIWYLGTENTPPGDLSVYKNDQLILRESVIKK